MKPKGSRGNIINDSGKKELREPDDIQWQDDEVPGAGDYAWEPRPGQHRDQQLQAGHQEVLPAVRGAGGGGPRPEALHRGR